MQFKNKVRLFSKQIKLTIVLMACKNLYSSCKQDILYEYNRRHVKKFKFFCIVFGIRVSVRV